MTTYEPGFKEEAVKLAIEIGTTQAASDLGIPSNTLYTWVRKAKMYGENAHVGSGKKRGSLANTENTKILRRIKELEKANKVLFL